MLRYRDSATHQMTTQDGYWSSFKVDCNVETDSLQRRVKHMSHQLAGQKREHSEEMAAKDKSLDDGVTKRQKQQRLHTQLKKSKYRPDRNGSSMTVGP